MHRVAGKKKSGQYCHEFLHTRMFDPELFKKKKKRDLGFWKKKNAAARNQLMLEFIQGMKISH